MITNVKTNHALLKWGISEREKCEGFYHFSMFENGVRNCGRSCKKGSYELRRKMATEQRIANEEKQSGYLLFPKVMGEGIAFFSAITKNEAELIEGTLAGEYMAAFNSRRDAAK